MKNYIKRMRDLWHSDSRIFNNQMNSIASYCNNEALIKQGNIENSDIYKYFKSIHEIMPLYDILDKNIEKIRLGRNYDGGYVMISPLSKEKIAYSIGICDDISWDQDMVNRGYQIYQYDHTIKKLPNKNNNFHWKKQGITGGTESEIMKTLESMIRENGHSDKSSMVLKMDVEGYEWDVLKKINAEVLNQFDQIVMELHHVLNYERKDIIIPALKNLTANHSLVHLHANNVCRVNYCGKMITPATLEVTLVKNDLYPLEKSNIILPTIMDQPNFSQLQEIYIGNWNIIE